MRTKKTGQKKTVFDIGDIISVAGVLLLSFLVWSLFFLSGKGDGETVVVIEGGSKTVSEYDLGHDGVYQITSSNGHILTLEINDGNVSVTSSTCDNGYCVGMGKINGTGETIVCAPAKIKIKIVSDEEVGQNDFIVG